MLTIVIIVVCALILLIAGLFCAVVISGRRGGKLSQRVAETALKNDRVAQYASEKAVQEMTENPERLQEMLVEQGANRQMRDAAQKFTTLPAEQQAKLLRQAQAGEPLDVSVLQTSAGRKRAQDQAAAKRKTKARAARKAAKKSRSR